MLPVWELSGSCLGHQLRKLDRAWAASYLIRSGRWACVASVNHRAAVASQSRFRPNPRFAPPCGAPRFRLRLSPQLAVAKPVSLARMIPQSWSVTYPRPANPQPYLTTRRYPHPCLPNPASLLAGSSTLRSPCSSRLSRTTGSTWESGFVIGLTLACLHRQSQG